MPDFGWASMDEFSSEFDGCVRFGIVQCKDSSSDAITRFEKPNREPGGRKHTSGRQTGHPSSNYNDIQLFRHFNPFCGGGGCCSSLTERPVLLRITYPPHPKSHSTRCDLEQCVGRGFDAWFRTIRNFHFRTPA